MNSGVGLSGLWSAGFAILAGIGSGNGGNHRCGVATSSWSISPPYSPIARGGAIILAHIAQFHRFDQRVAHALIGNGDGTGVRLLSHCWISAFCCASMASIRCSGVASASNDFIGSRC